MIGTGPFKQTTDLQLPNGPNTFEANEDYWQKGYPKADSITFVTQSDGVQRDNGLKTGAFDVIHQSGALQIDDLKSQGGGITLLEQKPGLREIRYYFLNSSKPPFDDPDARLALQYAIDRTKINELLNGGLFEQANSLMDKDAPGYVKNAGYPKYNKKKAKELVDEYKAAHGGVFEVTFLTSGPDAQNKAEAEELKAQVEAVGITANISQVEQTVLISNAVSGQFSVFLWRNLHGGNTQSCDADVGPWFSNNPPDLVNFGKFTDPDTQALIDQIRNATDPAAVESACTEFNETMAAKGYLLPSWYVNWTIAAADGVKIVLPKLPDGGGKPLFVYGRIPVLGLTKS